MSTALLCTNLIFYSLQIGLLVGIAGLAPALLRMRSARARLAYYHALLAACLLLPLIQNWKRESVTVTAQIGQSTVAVGAPSPTSSRRWPLREAALLLLAAGMLVGVGRLGAGFWRLRRLRRTSRPFEGALAADIGVTVLVSPEIHSPVTFGFFEPVILLPERFPDLDSRAREAILYHELLHVMRHDWPYTVGEELVRAVFWFHPAIWWLLGEIGLAREETVDREVIERTASREEYVDALLAMAGAGDQPDLALASPFLRKGHLKRRVFSILKEARMSRARLLSAFVTAMVVLASAGWLVTAAFPMMASPQMVVDGAGVIVDLGGATVVHRVSVDYPAAARSGGISGTVTVEAALDAQGNVTDARALGGPAELRRAAIESVLQWHFARSLGGTARQVNITFQAAAGAAASQPRVRFLEGRKIKSIEVKGLSEEASKELLSRLPVRAEETLTTDSMNRLLQVVREYDEHLAVNITQTQPEQLAIRIMLKTGAPPPPPPPPSLPSGEKLAPRPKITFQVTPAYPPLAKQARIQGVVRFIATIEPDGSVADLKVISGHPLLVQSAIEAVKQWVFEPSDAQVITDLDVTFTLSQ